MRLAVAAVALALAGCADAPETVAAEQAVSREAGTDRVECTGRSRIWFREGEPAELVLCIARRESGRSWTIAFLYDLTGSIRLGTEFTQVSGHRGSASKDEHSYTVEARYQF